MTARVPLPWLAEPLAAFGERLARGHVPQALLIHGPEGVGRRALATAIAVRLLGGPDEVPAQPAQSTGAGDITHHPDFLEVTLIEDRKLIVVDQVRELVHALSLTSHQGGRKVAMICPAEALNPSAANSLLKTLEEPPGQATIILVGSAPARLPATVVSRCERLRLSTPPRSVALAWLREAGVGPTAAAGAAAHVVGDGGLSDCEWAALLDFAAGAPLLARDLAAADFATTMAALEDDLGKLAARTDTPLAVGRRWTRQDAGLCLRWLYGRVTRLVQERLAGSSQEPAAGGLIVPLKNPAGRPNINDCYHYLDRLTQAMRLLDRGLNMEVQIADLLMWWYGASSGARAARSR